MRKLTHSSATTACRDSICSLERGQEDKEFYRKCAAVPWPYDKNLNRERDERDERNDESNKYTPNYSSHWVVVVVVVKNKLPSRTRIAQPPPAVYAPRRCDQYIYSISPLFRSRHNATDNSANCRSAASSPLHTVRRPHIQLDLFLR